MLVNPTPPSKVTKSNITAQSLLNPIYFTHKERLIKFHKVLSLKINFIKS